MVKGSLAMSSDKERILQIQLPDPGENSDYLSRIFGSRWEKS